ncbi:hypothetical protein K523DRAFT_319305 [Schizophyllum commune Tattone D]|nr:hypothetical protein K523DRAFT_319305 [Schizophyllum commune Tattone D]
MSFSPKHARFLDSLDTLTSVSLSPLPERKQQVEFNKRVREKIAFLRSMTKRGAARFTIGRPVSGSKQRKAVAPVVAPAPALPVLPLVTAFSRARDILTAPRHPRSIQDVWDVALTKPDGVRSELEDAALARLLQGIETHPAHVWSESSPYNNAGHQAAVALLGLESERLDDAGRLVQLHNRICTSETVVDAKSFGGTVRIQLDTIEFGLRWQAIGSLRGGRSVEKEEFALNAYLSLHPGMTRADIARDNAAFALWKKNAIEPIVCGRNRLVHAYRKFGYLVLLDPFWTARSLSNKTRTKDFPAIFLQLLQANGIVRSRTDKAVLAFLDGCFDHKTNARVRVLRALESELFELDQGEDEGVDDEMEDIEEESEEEYY